MTTSTAPTCTKQYYEVLADGARGEATRLCGADIEPVCLGCAKELRSLGAPIGPVCWERWKCSFGHPVEVPE